MSVTVQQIGRSIKVSVNQETFAFNGDGGANKIKRLDFFIVQIRDDKQYVEFKYEDLTDNLGTATIDEFVDLVNTFFFHNC